MVPLLLQRPSSYGHFSHTVRVGSRHAPDHGWRMCTVAYTLQPSSSPPPERSVYATVVAGSPSDEVENRSEGRASVAYSVQPPSGAGSTASRHGRKSGKRVEKSCLFRILCEYRRKSGTSPPAATARPGSSANIDENPENAFESAAFSGFSSCEPRRPCPSQSAQNGHSGREGLGGNRSPTPVLLRDRTSAFGTEPRQLEPRPERRIHIERETSPFTLQPSLFPPSVAALWVQ